MKKTDRFLLAIVIGALLLVVVAFFVALNRPETAYVAEDTPEGVVNNYLLALQKGDDARAFGYLSESIPYLPASLDEFERDMEYYQGHYFDSAVSLSIGDTDIHGDKAQVEVRETTYYGDGPFGGGQYTTTFYFSLTLENGQWKIMQGDAYFVWCWTEPGGCAQYMPALPRPKFSP